MTDDALPAIADAAQLTRTLQGSGVLQGAAVRRAVVESSCNTILSRVIRLRLDYDGSALGAPTRLFLKTSLPERTAGGWLGGRQEVAFYRDVAGRTPAILPRCFGHHWDPRTNQWFVLLEDLTDTHEIATQRPLPPLSLSARRSSAPGPASTRRGGAVPRWAARSAPSSMTPRATCGCAS